MFKQLRENHKKFWVRPTIKSLLYSAGFFTLAGIVEAFADNYVIKTKGTAVSDLILDHLRVADIDSLIIMSALLLTFAGVFLFLYKPKYLNFGMRSLSVFIIIRSFLIILTHLGANPHQITFDTSSPGFGLYNILFNSHNDFFFSGHTGVPFLLALIFWPEKPWRYIFMAASLLFGIFVLLAHIHYSIDVVAAPFMTYSIYILSERLFKKDYLFSLKN